MHGLPSTLLVFALLSGLAASPAAAQAMSSDRPRIHVSPMAVKPGVLQLELGGRAAWGGSASTGLDLTQRFGLIPGLELRMRVPMTTAGSVSSPRFGWGAKWQVLEGYLLSLGALANVDLDALGQPTSHAWGLATLGLPAGFALTLNGGPHAGPLGLTWTGAAALGYDSGDLWRLHGEVARCPDPGTGSAVGWAMTTGLQALVTRDVLWDVSVFRGLTPEHSDWSLTSGFAVRWGSR